MKKILRKFLRNDDSKPQAREVPAPKEPQEYGLKLVYESDNPSIDIVAVHGHGGHWKNSWTFTQDDGTDTFWLHDFLPETLPSTRILSFGYDASDALASSVGEVADSFLLDLFRMKSETKTENRPCIFIAHSFGGMILKGMLGECEGLWPAQPMANLRSSTYGILFLGVPEDAKAPFGNLGPEILATNDSSNTPLIAALKRESSWLQEAIGRYDQISDEFIVTYFRESDGTSISSQVALVEAQQIKVIRLNKIHGMMTRYATPEDDDFKKIAACLGDLAEKAPQTTESITWFIRS